MFYRRIGSPGDGPPPYSAKHTQTVCGRAGDIGAYWICHSNRIYVSPLKKISHSKEATGSVTIWCSSDLESSRTNQWTRQNPVPPWEKKVLSAADWKSNYGRTGPMLFSFGIFHSSIIMNIIILIFSPSPSSNLLLLHQIYLKSYQLMLSGCSKQP